MSDYLTKERVEEDFRDFNEDIIIDVEGQNLIVTYDIDTATMIEITGTADIMDTESLLQDVKEMYERETVVKHLFRLISENDCDVYVRGDEDE